MAFETPNIYPENEDHFRYTEEQKGELMTRLLSEGMTEQQAVEEIVRREEAEAGNQ